MDENKRATLTSIGFTVRQTCGLCKHGKFKPNNDFGDCAIQSYKHLKHSADTKLLSVPKFGACPKFEADPEKLKFLHAFTEFIK